MDLRWNDWNIEHATQHGVSIQEIEALIDSARAPFPEYRGDGKWLVQGRGQGDRLIQAIYLLDGPGMAYVIHSRELRDQEKRRYRRRLR